MISAMLSERVCRKTLSLGLLFLFVAVPLIMSTSAHDQFELPKLTALRIVLSFLLLLLLLRSLRNKSWSFRRDALNLPLALLLFVHLLATVISVSPATSFYGDYENFAGLLSFVSYAALFWLIVHLAEKSEMEKYITLALSAGATVAGYALAQRQGLDLIRWQETSVIAGRAFATLGNPNFLSAYLAALLPLVIYRLLRHRVADGWSFLHFTATAAAIFLVLHWTARHACADQRGLPLFAALGLSGGIFFILAALCRRLAAVRWATPLALFGLASCLYLAAMMATGSRGGVLALLPTIVLLPGLLIWKLPGPRLGRRQWLAAGLLLLALAGSGHHYGRPLFQRLSHDLKTFSWQTERSRLHIWVPALRVIAAHPWLGSGLDTFKIVFPTFNDERFAQIDGMFVSSRTAHNEFLQFAATLGLPALGLYLWLLMLALIRQLSLLRSSSRDGDAPLRAALLAGWCAYLVQSTVSFGVACTLLFFWAWLGFALALRPGVGRRLTFSPPAWLFILTAGLLTLLSIHAVGLLSADIFFQEAQGLHNYAGELENQDQSSSAAGLAGLYAGEYQLMRRARRLAPFEVKYQLYSALAAEKAYSFNRQLPWWEQARDDYLQAVRISPFNSYYYNNLGRLYEQNSSCSAKEWGSAAEAYYQQAIKLAPATAFFRCNLAALYFQLGRDEAGLQALQQAFARNGDFTARQGLILARGYLTRGRDKLAEKIIRFLLRQRPRDADANYYLAFLMFGRGQITEGRRYLEETLRIDPAHAGALDLQRQVKTR